METVIPMGTPLNRRDKRMGMDRISPMAYPHTSTTMAMLRSFFHRHPLSFNRLCISTIIIMVIPIPIPIRMVTEAVNAVASFLVTALGMSFTIGDKLFC
ncbi:hypothetical protein DIZ81_04995 [Legionella taurinensis]|uniref:Uncharacterized protein n=1 Tax=Legionella taurinensis TaxID=70611 RepID=A0AB38N609_9GAMM|nr:hypothetical protein [Legionella taurinensis]MDX1837031.1 hypothetical protein [Legionella taurinensis]PUT42674.1 hypothetical protein DB746_07330 [Legionella taurinensis]PUT46702.1 hypothetical protein DB743_04730 [Legionella taurinensis]TID36855.1 hypothetical protein DIZ41_04730 [Legionella taurinensis]TID43780.1 hypothetical protein DIZ37_07330 [Legionella taurinensis]